MKPEAFLLFQHLLLYNDTQITSKTMINPYVKDTALYFFVDFTSLVDFSTFLVANPHEKPKHIVITIHATLEKYTLEV